MIQKIQYFPSVLEVFAFLQILESCPIRSSLIALQYIICPAGLFDLMGCCGITFEDNFDCLDSAPLFNLISRAKLCVSDFWSVILRFFRICFRWVSICRRFLSSIDVHCIVSR